MKSILITGASGFVGRNLLKELVKLNKYNITAIFRKKEKDLSEVVNQLIVEDLVNFQDYCQSLKSPNYMIHLAGIAHKKKVNKADFDLINVDITAKLLKWSKEKQVERFIYLSSVGVNGQLSKEPFNENDKPNPKEYYAISKLLAENKIIKNINQNEITKYVIIRSPLIYGRNAPGNFRLLQKWINSPFPLPFGMVNNKRSIISINNLIDFIKLTLNHKNASNQIFLVSDPVPISTRDLVNKLIQSQNSLFKNLKIPKSILLFILTILNKKNLANKVLGSLEIDWRKSSALLGWKPPFNTSDELEKTITGQYD
tara:strand:+ start:13473 stop:14411 length:939 start_codon:yes stop_codon:yes gene_type:complete